jgi:anti-sigma-K factor RskA
MNAERHEELAALAALDLLTPAEQTEFAGALAAHPELAALVAALRSSSAELAHLAPAAEPPAALKVRVLSTVATLPAYGAQPAQRNAPLRPSGKLIAFPAWIAFAAAACFALTAAYFGQAYLNERQTNAALLNQQTLADLALRGARNQLEAERLIARRELADAVAQSAESTRLVSTLEARLAEAARGASDAARQLAASREQIAAARRELTAREQRVADLSRQLAAQGQLADYKIATLASLLGNSPQALAVAVWNPANQEGVLTVQKLPALAEDKDYQLWVVDPQYPIPVDGGVFRVDPATGEGRIHFHPNLPVKTVAKFAVSLERKGGVPKAEGPMVLIGP